MVKNRKDNITRNVKKTKNTDKQYKQGRIIRSQNRTIIYRLIDYN